MTNEQIRKAAEIAIHGALGVTPGECLAEVHDDDGNHIQEIGFRLRNDKQDGQIEIYVWDDEAETERTLRFQVRLELVGIDG